MTRTTIEDVAAALIPPAISRHPTPDDLLVALIYGMLFAHAMPGLAGELREGLPTDLVNRTEQTLARRLGEIPQLEPAMKTWSYADDPDDEAPGWMILRDNFPSASVAYANEPGEVEYSAFSREDARLIAQFIVKACNSRESSQ